MFYADDLVLTRESREEVEDMFAQWKEAMEIRGVSMNMGKRKLMVSGASGVQHLTRILFEG